MKIALIIFAIVIVVVIVGEIFKYVLGKSVAKRVITNHNGFVTETNDFFMKCINLIEEIKDGFIQIGDEQYIPFLDQLSGKIQKMMEQGVAVDENTNDDYVLALNDEMLRRIHYFEIQELPAIEKIIDEIETQGGRDTYQTVLIQLNAIILGFSLVDGVNTVEDIEKAFATGMKEKQDAANGDATDRSHLWVWSREWKELKLKIVELSNRAQERKIRYQSE